MKVFWYSYFASLQNQKLSETFFFLCYYNYNSNKVIKSIKSSRLHIVHGK